MGCHPQFPPSYDELEGIRTLKEHWEAKKPIEWVQIHRLPEYVQFRHNRHVAAGVECQTCHGAVQEMDKVYLASRHELVAVALADAEARDGLVHPVPPGERRVAGLRDVSLLGSGSPWPSSIVVIS